MNQETKTIQIKPGEPQQITFLIASSVPLQVPVDAMREYFFNSIGKQIFYGGHNVYVGELNVIEVPAIESGEQDKNTEEADV